MTSGIDRLVICSPYEAPGEHWRYDRSTGRHERAPGRRPAGYVRAAPPSGRPADDPGEFRQLRLPNLVRKRVDRWRDAGYPGITATTRRLLSHWRDAGARAERLFFCQIEAIETIIWMTEADESDRAGLDVPGDGGEFRRLCLKMATGTGKTVVMAMLVAWQALNKAASPGDGRFSSRFLVVAPGLTVKSRLGVLWPPDGADSYCRRYSIVPDSMYEDLKRATVSVHNWHTLAPRGDARHGVVRKGPEDDAAFASRILRHGGGNVVVINDEAHHAWRRAPGGGRAAGREERELEEMATVWMEGLDRIHRARGIRACFDFTATPFVPSAGRRSPGGAAAGDDGHLYGWVVYDFSLSDAIESGLVKTPRMPAGDGDAPLEAGDRSKYYHLYGDPSVRPALKGGAGLDEPLPDVVRAAYMILASDWRRTRAAAEKAGSQVPPVMITVCNNTRTAARIERFFRAGPYDFGELASGRGMVRIDTDVLRMDRRGAGGGGGDELRDAVNTVGQPGRRGEQIKNIVAVQMLSEGWDAKNVTQIMGLRAFTSQLLCEQVIGRGLRRQSYEPDPETGLLAEEYVNVLGVPFSFLPHEDAPIVDPPPAPRRRVGPDPDNAGHEISWPNAARIETVLSPVLRVDWASARRLGLSAGQIDDTVQLAPVLGGMPDISRASIATLHDDYDHLRMQTIVFHTVLAMHGEVAVPRWRGDRHLLFAQLAGVTSRFIESGMIAVTGVAGGHEMRRRLAIMFNMRTVVDHVLGLVRAGSTESKRLVFAHGAKSRSTGDVRPWYTAKGVERAAKSHINPSPYDSAWERDAAREFERNGRVLSWVKNERRVGLAIRYKHDGAVHDYYPDYLVRLGRGKGGGGKAKATTLVLEIKGQRTPRSDAKHAALREWVDAVNGHGGHGRWACDIAYDPGDVAPIIKRHCP